jgi:pimeloyl-ACP methyl ester carboxylesterase
MNAAPEIRFFKAPSGHNVAYASHGDGPLVVCPAWWISHVEKDWQHAPFRDFFERLGRGLRVVRYDRPGVGLSDRDARGRTYEDETETLAAVIDELGAEQVSLFAVSCGGPPALAYAAARPDKVGKICMYGTYGCGNDLGPPEVQEAVAALVRAHWGLGARAMADLFLPDASRAELDQLIAHQRDGADVEVAEELLRLTYAMDASDFLERIVAECLIIHRRGDRAVPHSAGRRLATSLKNARLVTLDGDAHPPWMRGDEVAGLANQFLGGAPVATAHAGADGPCRFDAANRQLVVEGAVVALTPLEFGVMQQLVQRENAVVTRDDLLQAVWKQQFEGSNKIDAVVRNLRKKLGRFAPSIRTVIGHGYRFGGWTDKADS